MNYQKKRKRQNGRQGGWESALNKYYRQKIYIDESGFLTGLIDANILPKIDFDINTIEVSIHAPQD